MLQLIHDIELKSSSSIKLRTINSRCKNTGQSPCTFLTLENGLAGDSKGVARVYLLPRHWQACHCMIVQIRRCSDLGGGGGGGGGDHFFNKNCDFLLLLVDTK